MKLSLLAVDRAGPEKLKAFMEDVGTSHLKILRDPKMASMRAFEIQGLPTTIVLDAKGERIASHIGYDEWDRPEIVGKLRTLLSDG